MLDVVGMWLPVNKFTEVICHRESHQVLYGRAQMDDACSGGEYTGGKSGRASENKVSLMAGVQTTSNGNPIVMFQHMLLFTMAAVESSKPTVTRTYHAFDFAKCKHRYHAQVERQFNIRLDLMVMFLCLMGAVSLTLRQVECTLRLAEVHRKSILNMSVDNMR